MRISVGGIAINYQLDGAASAPVVTFSHALGARLSLFDAQAAALRDRWRVLRHDSRGHGDSDVPPGPYTLEQMAGDVLGLLDALDVRTTHFVGLSMGGLVGMTAALVAPDRVRSLVLCDTTACYGETVRPMWEERIRVAEAEGMSATLVERTMDIWFSPGFRERHKDVVDRVRDMLGTTDPRGYAAAIRAIGFVDLRPRLAEIRCPTLVVVGEDDPGTTPAMARVLQGGIPGARLLVLPGARHCSVVEAADRFDTALRAFLAAC
jgi:3-oxoadipate enol-lactonase